MSVISTNPSVLRDVTVPAAHRGHPLIAERHFYTVPKELLESIVEHVGETRFDAQLLALDRKLSGICGDHSDQIGFRDGVPIEYDLLGAPLSVLAALTEGMQKFGESLGWQPTTATQRASLAALDARSDWARRQSRAFAGWLVTNRQFNEEQLAFFTTWRTQIVQFGLDAPTAGGDGERSLLSSTLLPPPSPPSPPSGSIAPDYFRYVAARDQFLARWQLVSIAGPFLPSPARPQLPKVGLSSSDNADHLGVTFFFPHTSSLPTRDDLRAMIEDAMSRYRPPAHLAEWNELIVADSTQRKKLPPLERRFILQHYWRVLWARHSTALTGQLDTLHHAFAKFQFPTNDDTESAKPETVVKDLQILAKAFGGSDWYRQSNVYRSI